MVIVLTVLVLYNYSGIQAKKRNAKRESDLALIQRQIESFYIQNEYYPNLNDLNNAKWRNDNMKKLDPSNLVDPSNNCDPTKSACVSDTPKSKIISYQAFQSDGKTNCNGKVGSSADQYCAAYTLTATFEGTYNGSTTYVLHNL